MRSLFILFVLSLVSLGMGAPKVGIPPPPYPPFDCAAMTNPPPATEVTKLRPGNIKAIMAMGDSITAGFAMEGSTPLEYRGRVYDTGGDTVAHSVANFLRQKYNSGLVGWTTGTSIPLAKGKELNAAISGAVVQGLSGQVDYLVSTLKSSSYSSRVNFNNDWKLLTIFIGANNICGACHNGQNDLPATFEQQLVAALNKIQTQIPRVFVNIMTIFNISGVWTAGQTSAHCKQVFNTVTECGCLTKGGDADRKAMDATSSAYNQISEKVAAQFAAKNNANFTVVVQPGLEDLDIAYFGEDFLSNLDCFHPNENADASFAYALWNNMMQPVGKKSTNVDIKNLKFICPTADTYLQ